MREPMNEERKKQMYALEAILFAVGDAVPLEKIADALDIEEDAALKLVEDLSFSYESEGRGIQILELNGSYQLSTRPEMYDYLIKVAKQPQHYALTDVLLETLSIIAYKQPVTKAEIEKIRGVSSDHAVNKLVEYELVKELGRLNAPGRPLLFGTTEEFLRCFGVSSMEDLPLLDTLKIEEFKKQAEDEIYVDIESV